MYFITVPHVLLLPAMYFMTVQHVLLSPSEVLPVIGFVRAGPDATGCLLQPLELLRVGAALTREAHLGEGGEAR